MREYIKLIRDIFEKSDLKTKASAGDGFDFTAENVKSDYVVAVKMSRTPMLSSLVLEKAAQELMKAGSREEMTPVLVVIGTVMRKQRKELKKYESLIVVDIQNLLYMVQHTNRLKQELLSILDYSVDFLIPEKPDLDVIKPILLASPDDPEYEDSDEVKEKKRLDGLAALLDNWDHAASSSIAYEQICCDVLKTLFADDLALWKAQKPSNDGLFRFDLICKIKNGNEKEFWRMSERYFGSKYIVFEFKNYTAQIGQREVFTTVKYLYTKALRGVAFLISTHGIDDHGMRAIRGILRDEGKLILSLSNQDLVEMLKMKRRSDDPADYLSDKLDELLIDLEK